MLILAILSLLSAQPAQAALCSRVYNFTDGSILTASQLNTEFNNNVDCVNGITDANILGGAAILPSKISASIAGSAISRNVTTGALSAIPDGSTLEISSNALQVKDGGITLPKFATGVVSSIVDQVTLQYPSPGPSPVISIKDSGVTSAKLATDSVETAKIKDGNVTAAKIAAQTYSISSSVTQTITTNGGFSDVSGLSVTISAVAGKIIKFGLIGAPVGSGVNDGSQLLLSSGNVVVSKAFIQILRDSTSVFNDAYDATKGGAGTVLQLSPSVVNGVDIPGSSGTYTYKVQVYCPGNDTSLALTRVKLYAIQEQ